MGKYFILLAFTCLGVGGDSVFAQIPTAKNTNPETISVPKADGGTIELYKDKSYALVIGNSDYDFWGDLPGVTADVKAVSTALTDQGFVVEVEENLKSRALKDRVEKFIDDYGFKKNSRILIYFAGHGDEKKAQYGDSLGYIIPVDTPSFDQDEEGFRKKAIQFDQIESWAKKIQSLHAFFIFDSCFSGKLITRSELSIPPIVQEGMSFPVRQFMTSGSAGQKVGDDSPFRKSFVEGLKGAADRNYDGYISAEELASFVRDRVTNYTNRAQTPLFDTLRGYGLDRGDMIFSVPDEIKQKNSERATLAYAAVSKNDPDAMRTFAATYPGSREAKMALANAPGSDKAGASSRGGDPAVPAARPAPEIETIEFDSVWISSNGSDSLKKNSATVLNEKLDGGFKLTMVRIPEGKFKMGSVEYDNEKPAREVSMPEFYIGAYEITQAQWKAIAKTKQIDLSLPESPAYQRGDDLPIENISWEHAVEFCKRLSRETGQTYELPSEAQWEYAARGGTSGRFSLGDRLAPKVANYDALSDASAYSNYSIERGFRAETVPVGSLKAPNAFGLYDVHGNVAEWCLDNWKKGYEGAPPNAEPRLNPSSKQRVVRGGSWNSSPVDTRSSFRRFSNQTEGTSTIGFRVVLKSIKKY